MPDGVGPLDRLAILVNSTEFTLAFAWVAVLMTAFPLCLVCSLGFHATGELHLAASFGLFGVIATVVSAAKVFHLSGEVRGTIPR